MGEGIVHDFAVEGLRTIVISRSEMPVTACGVLVHAGSAMEADTQLGYAHFMEHLTVKGSSSMEPGEFPISVERLGLDMNGGTNAYLTLYFFDGLAENAEAGLGLLLDCVANPGFREDEMDTERGVVLNEFGDCDSDPQTMLEDEVRRRLYAGHPMGRDVLGTRESISVASAGGIRGFHERFYTRESITVLLVGDIDRASAERMVREHAACIRPASRLSDTDPLPPLPALAASVARIPLEIPSSSSAWATRSDGLLTRKENAVWEALADYLAWGQASPLVTRLREELGLVYFASAEANPGGYGTEFRFVWGAVPESERAIMATVREELERVADGGFREGRFESVMGHLRLRRVKASVQYASALMNAAGEIDAYGQVSTEAAIEGLYAGIRPDDLSAVAGTLLSGKWILVTVGQQPG